VKRLFACLASLLVATAAPAARPPLRLPAAEHLIVIGDLHGDLDAARRALRLGNAIDANDAWIGGDLVVVQTGDQLDRGNDEREILALLERLGTEAAASGGAVVVLDGNHELMNAGERFHYVTDGGYADFAEFAPAHIDPSDSLMLHVDPVKRGRLAAFRPGGPYARRLAERNVVQIVGDNLFVHGGVTSGHLERGLEAINAEIAAWLLGEGPDRPWLHTSESPTWCRLYSRAETDSARAELAAVLPALGVKRMVMGHTIQEGGITSRYDGRVWCVDVGMAAHYGGPVEVLEIRGDDLRVLREPWTVRAQVDTVGFATRIEDMAAVVRAALAAEGLDDAGAAGPAWTAAILPHDDHLYAGRTVVHALGGLRAKRWIILGVCHACRRQGVRDKLLFEDADAWNIGGETVRTAGMLRHLLRAELGDDAVLDTERHAAEHSIEALVPWLRQARPDAVFVPILVPGMSRERMAGLAARFGQVLADICREEQWVPGVDVGVLISADAVHYGCEGWGDRHYDPYGCDAPGHAAGTARDVEICVNDLGGEVTPASAWGFADAVWDESDPVYPYRITWCGVYSIPFGLLALDAWMDAAGLPPLSGTLLRYGDSVSDGRLDVSGTILGVTAPNTLQHWVGYPALGYAPLVTEESR
jgi:AmmeMemoRadiSam system protein B